MIVRVFYIMEGMEYSELLGLDELDPKADVWNNVTKVDLSGRTLYGGDLDLFLWVLDLLRG